MPRLPRLLAPTHGFQEGQERRNAESRGDDGEGSSCGVPHVLVDVVDIGPHGRNHGRQTRGLRQIRDDFSTFDTSVVIFVDQQRFYNDEYLRKEHQALIFQ